MAAASRKLAASPPAPMPASDGNWSFDAGSFGTLIGANCILNPGGLQVAVLASSSILAIDVLSGEQIAGKNLPYQPDFQDDEGFSLVCAAAGCVYFVEQGKLRALQLHDGRFKGAAPSGQSNDGFDGSGWADADVSGAFQVAGVGDILVVLRTVKTGNAPASVQMCGYSTSAGGPGLWKVTLDNLSGTFGPVNQTATSTFFCCNGTLYAHTITRVFSEQAWSFPNATLPPGQPVPKMDARYAPQISEASGSLVSLGAENDVFALSLKRGTQRWRFPFANTAALLQPVICETLGLVVLVDVQANGGKGEVLGVDLKTGALAWRQPMGGESGALADPLIEGTVLYLSGKRFQGFSLESFGKEGQQVDRIADIALEELGGSGDGLVVVNGAVIFPTSANTVICHRFSEERAAWFDGAQSCITLKPEDHSFLPGTGDFTLEAWVRTSSGGEVICVQPEDALTYGARLNISANGELQFAVINQQGGGSIYWSKSTPATDGRWHHVAVMRRLGHAVVFLDGDSVPVSNNASDPSKTYESTYGLLPISGRLQITIGCARWKDKQGSFFSGLVKDVRLWDVAIEAPKLRSRMGVELTGLEPRLQVLLRCDEESPANIENRVTSRAVTATGVAMAWTDLALDSSAFPYLLNQAQPTWPYAQSSHWGAKGEEPPVTAAVLDEASGTVCWATGNALYGVSSGDGRRLWGVRVAKGVSAPTAFNGWFYVMTPDEGLIAVNAVSGERTIVEAAAQTASKAPPAVNVTAATPVINGKMMVVADMQGTISVHTRKDVSEKDSTTPSFVTDSWTPDGLPKSGFASFLVDDKNLPGPALYAVYGDSIWNLHPLEKTPAVKVADAAVSGSCADSGTLFYVKRDTRRFESWTAGVVRSAPLPTDLKGDVTGMAASMDLQLLVVTTSEGTVWAFSFATLDLRWTQTVPAGPAGIAPKRKEQATASLQDGLVAPLIRNQEVYTAMRSGMVAALDARTGAFLALVPEPSCIVTPLTTQGVSGTLFFGTQEATGRQSTGGKVQLQVKDDGCMQSVVVGGTRALGLGVDHRLNAGAGNTALTDVPAYVAVDVPKHLGLDGESLTVEVWLSTTQSGELLTVSPAEDSPFGVNLSIGDAGRINFRCISRHASPADGPWTSLEATSVVTAVADGNWHHVAAVRKGQDKILLYLDGNLLSTEAAAPPATIPAPNKVTPGGHTSAYIGADSSPPTRQPFVGLLAEVRVWDTYRTAIELSSVMHTKLRGNEPDLLAYWNFDYMGLTDNTHGGLDGVLVQAGGSPVADPGAVYWLCDLPFQKPNYPWIETAATCTMVGEETGTLEQRTSTYQMNVTVKAADGSPLPGFEVHWWYVKHLVTTSPPDVQVSTTGGGPVTVSAVPEGDWDDSGDPPPGTTWPVTDRHGAVTFEIKVPDREFGPSFDLRVPGFMRDPHERFHANVLNDTQALKKPVPPSLTVQCELQQDYAYGDGPDAKIDETRSVPVYMVHVQALNADQTPRPGEQFQIYAVDHAKVVLNNKEYLISPDVGVPCTGSQTGEIMCHVAAEGATAPQLSIWAGFMHRGERQLVSPDSTAHDRMAKLQGSDMTDPKRPQSWSPQYENDREAGKEQSAPLLKDGVKPEVADQAAEAIRHVMSGVRPPEDPKPDPTVKGAAGSKVAAPGNQLLRRALLAVTPAAQAPDQHFMRQPQELSKAPDKVLVRPTVQHLQSRVKAAVSPEGVTASLGGQSGFVIEFGGKGSEVSVSKLATPEEVRKKNDEVQRAGIERAAAEGKVKAPPMMVKGFFDFDWVEDAWDDVKKAAQAVADAAEKLYEEAQAIVVEIGDQVSLFVHQLGEIVTVVVDSVEKAVAAVVGFLEKIYVLLKEFVEFLMMLFDWGAILKAHDVMRDVLRRGALAVADLFDPRNLGNLGAQLKAFILGQEPDPGKPKQSESLDTSNLITEDAQNIGGQCNTSQTKTMQKRAEVAAPATEYPPGAPPVAPKSGPDGEKGSKLIGDVLALLADVDGLLSGNPLAALPLIADLPNTIKDFFPFDPAELEDVLGGALGGIDNWAEEKGPAWMVVDAFWGMLDADLDIPFISMLYKWITGRSLTIASLLCLLTGLAAHIAHAFASLLLTGSARQFHEDAGGLADQTENQLRTLKQPRQSQNPAPKPTMRAAAKSVTLASGADVGEASPPSMAATAGEAGPDDPNKGDKGAAIALTVCYAVFGAGRLLTHRLVMIEQEEHRASGDTLWGDKEARECTAKLFGGDALLGLTTVAFLTGFRVASAKSREPQDMAATAVSGLVAAVPPILQLITAYNIYSDGTEGAPGTIGQQVAKLRRAVGGNPKKTIVVGGLAVLSFIAYTIAQGVRSGGDAQGIVGNIGTTVGIGASTYQFYISGADEIFSNNVAHMQEDAGRPGRPPADMDKVEFAIIVDAVGWVLQIAGMSIRAKELDG